MILYAALHIPICSKQDAVPNDMDTRKCTQNVFFLVNETVKGQIDIYLLGVMHDQGCQSLTMNSYLSSLGSMIVQRA